MKTDGLLKNSEYRSRLISLLPVDFDASAISYFDTVDSTSSYLLSLPDEERTGGRFVLADAQTGGRGRRGNSFWCEKRAGVYLSYIYDCHNEALESIYTVTSEIAVELCELISEYCGLPAGIKWVNDIIINGRKVAGILTEAVCGNPSGIPDRLIIGIGINVNNTGFPDDIRGKAGSLRSETGVEFPVQELAARLICMLSGFPERRKRRDDYREKYKALSVTLGREICYTFDGRECFGTVTDITPEYHLIIIESSGLRRELDAGVVSVRTENGYI